MAMPPMPLASRSSTIRRCSPAVPSDGILNSTSTSASSRSACSHPFRAIVQKSAALLVTKATFFEAPPGREQAKIVSPRNPHKHVSATRENLMLFSFIASSLGAHASCVPGLIHAEHAGRVCSAYLLQGAPPGSAPILRASVTHVEHAEACAPKCALGSLHFPLLDAGRPVRLHRNFEAQAARRHGFEGDLVEPVLLDGVRLASLDGFPLPAFPVEDAPGSRHPRLTTAGVIKPVDFNL